MRNTLSAAIAAAALIVGAAAEAQMQMPMPMPMPGQQQPAQGQMQMPMPGQPAQGGMQMPAQPAQAGAVVPVKGEVTRVDEANQRVSIRHEPIPYLNMGAMNMVFRLKDASLLQNVKVGDQVVFEADRVDGQLTILKMEKAPAANPAPNP